MTSIDSRIAVIEKMHQIEVDMMRRKAADYSGTEDCNKNIRACEALGIATAYQGLLIRMLDKMSRLGNVTKQGYNMQVKESVMDTLHDIRNYAGIFADLYQEQELKLLPISNAVVGRIDEINQISYEPGCCGKSSIKE